jgi:hypothetical protein
MLAERRTHAAAPLRDLSVPESLRLRRRRGRAIYLLALLTDRRGKQSAPSATERVTAQAAHTLPS